MWYRVLTLVALATCVSAQCRPLGVPRFLMPGCHPVIIRRGMCRIVGGVCAGDTNRPDLFRGASRCSRNPNQIYADCAADCTASCDFLFPTCSAACQAPRCECRPGYVRRSSDPLSECVLPNQCQQPGTGGGGPPTGDQGRRCRASFDCLSSQTCVSGRCTRRGATCDHDRHCLSTQQCFRGRCIARDQSECRFLTDCPLRDQVCVNRRCVSRGSTCEDDSACFPGQRCRFGTCTGGGSGGGGCRFDRECSRDERCQFGRCTPSRGGGCRFDRECSRDERCEFGRCISRGGGGRPPGCRFSSDCRFGQTCLFGQCVFRDQGGDGRRGQSCSRNSDCGSRRLTCVEGTCRRRGRRCDMNRDCRRGQTCVDGQCISRDVGICDMDADCTGRQVCRNNQCQDPSEGCQSNRDCERGEACVFSQCVPRRTPCSSDSDCRGRQTCVRSQCRGRTGGRRSGSGQTRRRESCSRTADCSLPNHVCVRGQCMMRDSSGGCSRNEDCGAGQSCTRSGNCIQIRPVQDAPRQTAVRVGSASASVNVQSPTDAAACGAFEEFDQCSRRASGCEPTCENPNPMVCLLSCAPGCQCVQGYFWNADDGVCITQEQCGSVGGSKCADGCPGPNQVCVNNRCVTAKTGEGDMQMDEPMAHAEPAKARRASDCTQSGCPGAQICVNGVCQTM